MIHPPITIYRSPIHLHRKLLYTVRYRSLINNRLNQRSPCLLFILDSHRLTWSSHYAMATGLYLLTLLLVHAGEAFLATRTQGPKFSPLFAIRKKKLNMAEKRKRRAKTPQRRHDLPPSKLDFAKPSKPLEATKAPNVKPTDSAEMSKAKELLEAQRASVATLTKVKECFEKIPAEDLARALESKGYWYTDNFLADATLIDQLQTEGSELLEKMKPDGLGSGEYVVNLQGGQEQYVQAPRSIEWVVSATKHFPSSDALPVLDSANCMGIMRTFDRKAFLASLNLLTGNEKSSESQRPLEPVVTDDSDLRVLSMRYYLVPSEWQFGGSLEFPEEVTVDACRDRLVIFKSDLPYRSLTWKGDNDNLRASCMELHLVKKTGN